MIGIERLKPMLIEPLRREAMLLATSPTRTKPLASWRRGT
jgi:hypothetical protein